MEINIIILPKNNNEIHLGIKKQVEKLFCLLFDEVKDNTFFVLLDDKKIPIKYLISAKEKNMSFLKLSCDATPARAAKCLDYATNRLIQGEHRKTWNIVITYDEVSQLYCCKLMPLFGEFERRTRELVYITIIKIFGVKWFDNSFSKRLQDELKGKGNKTKMVESALNELTYEQLKEYLFTPFSNRNFEEVAEQDFSQDIIDSLTKEEIISIVNQCRSESLWNRFFSQYKQFINFKEKIDELQPYRNIVMHNKRMTLSEYDKVRKLLKQSNKLLVEAITVIEDDIYTETKLVDVLSAFGSLLVKVLGESIPRWVEKMKPALSTLGELVIKSASPQINIANTIPALNIGNSMSSQLLGSMVNTSSLGAMSQINERVNSPAIENMRKIAEQNQRIINSMSAFDFSKGAEENEE